mmetsp:Transcript_10616/g.13359  ORF Transcript_10616/g.13359 Transcript_10616/m.13359 type:complete len:205 (-) Transcript_10616:1433-2047(-)
MDPFSMYSTTIINLFPTQLAPIKRIIFGCRRSFIKRTSYLNLRIDSCDSSWRAFTATIEPLYRHALTSAKAPVPMISRNSNSLGSISISLSTFLVSAGMFSISSSMSFLWASVGGWYWFPMDMFIELWFPDAPNPPLVGPSVLVGPLSEGGDCPELWARAGAGVPWVGPCSTGTGLRSVLGCRRSLLACVNPSFCSDKLLSCIT